MIFSPYRDLLIFTVTVHYPFSYLVVHTKKKKRERTCVVSCQTFRLQITICCSESVTRVVIKLCWT